MLLLSVTLQSHTLCARRIRDALLVSALLLLGGCGGGGDPGNSGHEMLSAKGVAPGPSADILLLSSSTDVSLTSDSEWSLSKTGSLSGNSVTWNITATKIATTSGHLVVQGTMTVTNTGNGAATIGNIVVNLQRRQGNSWVTNASDIANATQGDDATTANIHKAASSENKASFSETAGASGELEFMDATNNTLFSLVPQVLIGSGETRTLLFSASFDNNHAALKLTPGTRIRAEVIVTFGNATQSGNSTANVDINGNGTLDADEARIRSVPSRLTLTVPAAVNGNSTPTLTDTIDDIEATGVTFTNAQFNIGATTGTVTATVNGGTTGGTITNCAHLTTPDLTVSSGGSSFTTVQGLNLLKCSPVTVPGSVTPPPPCQPGQVGCRWKMGDLNTRTQLAWNASTSWYTAFPLVYGTFGSVEVGIPGTAGFSMRFSSGARVNDYFIQSEAPAALNKDLDDTTSSSSGQFGAEVLALQLNVDFSTADQIGGTSGVKFGTLTLCNMADSTLNGKTVSEVLAIANTLLGAGSVGAYSITQFNTLAVDLNVAFLDGTPTPFALTSLYNGPCSVTPPPPCTPGTAGCAWKIGNLTTYSQLQWGTSSTTAGNLLGANFVSLYGTNFVVGGNHTITFRLADALFAYLPDSSSAGVLTGSLLDPTSSSGGQLAGEVIALQLNVDFSEANILSSVTSLGDLHFCNTGLSTLDGLTVNDFLASANTLLGGGSAPYNVSIATGVASAINDAFASGTPSSFAQTSLVNGPCTN